MKRFDTSYSMESTMSKTWLITVMIAFGCASGGVTTPTGDAAGLRILFVGNSLTYTNDIPGLVKNLVVAAGLAAPTVVTRAEANFGLEDHWSMGAMQQDLRTGRFDVMIMQQGPSTLSSSGLNLTQWVGTLAAEARKYNSRPAVYAVWPPVGGNLEAGIQNYRAAADAANAAHYPASEAWQEAWRIDPATPLYGPDGFHPSPTGSLLAAMVITATIYDLDASSLANVMPTQVTEANMATLRAATRIAVTRSGRR